MRTPDEVAAMQRLHGLGWGTRRIAAEIGCNRETVQRYLAAGGWAPCRVPTRPSLLVGHTAWLDERLRRHRGNADVVRQELASELGIVVSLRTVERAVSHLRRELAAEALATVRFETPPGRQLQIDFGQRRIAIDGEQGKVFLFVATLGYSRRIALGYVHLIEGHTGPLALPEGLPSFLNIARDILDCGLIVNGGYDRASGEALITEGLVDAVAFGAPFIANPDLVERFANDWPIATAAHAVFYGGDAGGYIDFPAYSEKQDA
jgi:transposase